MKTMDELRATMEKRRKEEKKSGPDPESLSESLREDDQGGV